MRAHWMPILVWLSSMTALAADAPKPSIIPIPQKMETRAGHFRLIPETRIYIDGEGSRETAQYLATKLRTPTWYALPIDTNDELLKGVIKLTTKGATPE